MPLRAWIHCGSCNHLWKTSGVGLLCRWIAGGGVRVHVPAPELANEVTEPPRTSTAIDPSIDQWLSQGSDVDARRGADLSVSDWVEMESLEPPRRPDITDEYVAPLPAKVAVPAPATLGERLDTFYDGLVRLEQFVKRCALQEAAVAETATQPVAASESPSPADTATENRRGAVLPFHRRAG